VIDYLLDTNAIIALLTQRSDRLLARIRALQPGQIGLSAVVVHELYFGAYKSQKIDFNLETIRRLLADLVVLELDREDARAAGEIRAALARKGTPIGPYDVLIAGQAVARKLTLVTNNTAEFSRVDTLRLEDWTL
jgi:tRNA(fMet)-specific endonuclease VapC